MAPDVIRIIISCKKDERVYPVIFNVLTDDYFFYDYYLEESRGFLSDIVNSFYYPQIHLLQQTQNNQNGWNCSLNLLTDDFNITSGYRCAAKLNANIPEMLKSWPLHINNGKLKYFKYSWTNNVLNTVDIKINGLARELTNSFDLFDITPDSGKVILYSESQKMFYFTEPSTRVRFTLQADTTCNEQWIKMKTNSSLESCAHFCYKQVDDKCTSFTFDDNMDCFLHSSEVLKAESHRSCYIVYQE
ncbi:hypothetical protein EB796_005878 [Bugula neritina]|uniref:Apple domain-containing protein n=1 Tax=Bugula neritina TaxID=10212 RepID=A0A7J7KD71_BUGNE|nr:hypothetical protein EB796_005878 [Bugula neritina]